MEKQTSPVRAPTSAMSAWRFLTRRDKGRSRFFTDQAYHFQTLRALGDAAFGGADISEILETIKHIEANDVESWFNAWERTADRVASSARSIVDPISKGHALLRAHNYYRTAEFLLLPEDSRRPAAWRKNTDAFYEGIKTLGVKYERIQVPYQHTWLDALYFPGPEGAEKLPLLVICGGYDSTLEELYFVLGAAARQRGYAVLAYEGPGQGSALRNKNLVFTHEWEKPTSAVIEAFLTRYPKPSKLVLVGGSMGGYLAPRAAAFDDRIDGVVAYDVFFDMGTAAARNLPGIALWLLDKGFDKTVTWMCSVKAAINPGFAWALRNGMWVLGTRSPMETLATFQRYTLEPVASQIRSDVLILAGAEDHFVPIEQVGQFETSLTSARSVKTVVFDRESGGAEHCQVGAHTLWHATLFDWLRNKYPSAPA